MTPRKKLIVFATLDEAASTLKDRQAQPIDSFSYHYKGGTIVISGIGSYAAQMCVARYAIGADEIINMGFAASLKEHPIGKLFSCSTVSKYTPLLEPLDSISMDFMDRAIPKKFLPVTHGVSLISSDFPVHSLHQRENLQKFGDLLDMEGYGVAYAASYMKIKCTLLKVVSDFAQEGGRNYIEKHKEELSKILSKILN